MNKSLKKIGKQSYKFSNRICIKETSCFVGPTEGEGPLKNTFDKVLKDDLLGEKTFEKAEHKMCLENILNLLRKSRLDKKDIDVYIGGDLLNQITTTNLTARDLNIPFYGVYNACATFVESIQLGSVLLDGGFINKAIISATSHFSTAERQYRFPLELGTQSPCYSQRTVTGSGSMILEIGEKKPSISYMTIGKVVDFNQNDPNNMGSAMAAAACDTILAHFEDTKFTLDDYDLIITGDLGTVGYDITRDFLKAQNFDIENHYKDCGMLMYDIDKQDVMCGGSGAGCSASVFSGYLYKQLKEKKLNKILLVATGALLSPVSSGQKENIPCIAHAVTIES